MAQPCPLKGCIYPAGKDRFLCRSHWWGTPKPLRDEIWRAWRAYSAAREPEKKLIALRDYRAARDAVLKWWSE
jgi:hypothetical protein